MRNYKSEILSRYNAEDLRFAKVVLVIGVWLLFLASWLFIVPVVALDNPEQKITTAIKEYVVERYPSFTRDEIKVSFKFADKIFEELSGFPENTQFKVIEVYPEFKPLGNVVFPLEIRSENDMKKLFLKAKVEVFKKIVVATKRIKKRNVIVEDDLKVEERDVALLPQKYYVTTEQLLGKEAKINIPANSTIFEWMVGEVPLIRQGSEVTIVVSAPGLTVKTKGEAIEDGYRDGKIKVKRKETNKIVEGEIISPTEVEVKL